MSHDEYASRSYLPELDGLRALSILLVISVHTKDKSWEWLSGHLGVTVFFVLSGYLITRLSLREEHMSGSLNLSAFFVRRIFRLFPLYFLVLAIYCILILGLGLFPEKHNALLAVLPYYLLYFQEYPFFIGVNNNYWNIPFYQTWSLGIEEKFYLLWPFIGFWLWNKRTRTRLFGTIILYLFMVLSPVILGPVIGRFLFSYSHILIGCLLALCLDDINWYRRLCCLRNPVATCIALVTLLSLHFTFPFVIDGWRLFTHSCYAIVMTIFLLTLLLNAGSIQKWLKCKPLVLVGKLSYGMYLIHLFATNAADKVIVPGSDSIIYPAMSYALACILSIIMAYFLSVVIERPGIAIGKRISARLQKRRQPCAANTVSTAFLVS